MDSPFIDILSSYRGCKHHSAKHASEIHHSGSYISKAEKYSTDPLKDFGFAIITTATATIL